MFLDRFFGIEQHLYLSDAIKAYGFDDWRGESLELVRLYFPELYILAVLKCKKRHWKRTVTNVSDLCDNLCKKINFNLSKARVPAKGLQARLNLEEPFSNMHIEDCERISQKDKLFKLYFNEYITLRNKSIALLNSHNINPQNLAFGSFIDMTMVVYGQIFKNET